MNDRAENLTMLELNWNVNLGLSQYLKCLEYLTICLNKIVNSKENSTEQFDGVR